MPAISEPENHSIIVDRLIAAMTQANMTAKSEIANEHSFGHHGSGRRKSADFIAQI